MTAVSRPAVVVAMCALLAFVSLAYWPGLNGPFLFDDYGNLDVLGAYGRIDTWPKFLYFLTSGNADPTGRPVALLTFLLDAQTWPADPWPLKRTNLVLHLLNIVLLAWVVARLQAGLQRRCPRLGASPWTPLLAAGLWGAHPFLVSTTLYVVQREAMLPMTFVLWAVLAWDRAVLCFGRQRIAAGWAWAVVGLGGATVLAGLSKANGLLAPLLAGLAWIYFLRPLQPSPGMSHRSQYTAAALCIGVPSFVVIGYLLQTGWHYWSLPLLEGRDWTLPQRLMSEPRALWDYLWRLALPRAGGGGIFVDDFAVSQGWLSPATTLPAMLALAGSLVAAIAVRRRYPLASFAWLFFLAAHLMESSTIPLELYFEHRNYLPAAMLGWPVAHALLRPGGQSHYRAALAASLLGALLLLTHQRALVWGDPQLLGALSAAHETDSARAQVEAARQQVERGDERGGLVRIRNAQIAHPGSVDIAITAIGLECASTGRLPSSTLSAAQRTLSNATTWNYGLYEWMQAAIREEDTRRCHGFGLSGLAALVASAEANPQSRQDASRKRDLAHIRGRIALALQQPETALSWFDKALLAAPDPDYALVQAALLGSSGEPALGLRHLDYFADIESSARTAPLRDMAALHRRLLRHYGYYNRELSRLRKQLAIEARQQMGNTK